MGCCLRSSPGVFPRLAVLIVWIARPERVDAAFSTLLWPLLGIVFLPFATLIYLLLYTLGRGLSGGRGARPRGRRGVGCRPPRRGGG
jgi:hypothetical protein